MISKFYTGFERLQILSIRKLGYKLLKNELFQNRFIKEFLKAYYILSVDSIKFLLDRLRGFRNVIVDVIGEYSKKYIEAEEYLRANIKLVNNLPINSFFKYQLALKPSAFCWIFDTKIESQLNLLLKLANEKGIPVVFDAEDYETNQKFKNIFFKFLNLGYLVGWVVQGYWRNANQLLEEIDKNKRRTVFIRFVKGAYFNREIGRRSGEMYLTVPEVEENIFNLIQNLKKSLSSDYEVAVGTHRLSFIDSLINFSDIELQFLYGLGNGLYKYFENRGMRCRLYIPVDLGSFDPTLYLLRRAQENSDPFGFLNELSEKILD